MHDATLTDIEFLRDFANKQTDWMCASRPSEPDLTIDGLRASLIARILAFFGLG